MTTVSKRKLIGMSKYNLFGNWPMYISTGAVLIVNCIISLIISLSSGGEAGGGSMDGTMLGMSIAFGAVMCATGLKFALVNGVSRKTYYISVAASVVISAAVYSVVTSLLMVITHNVGMSNDMYYFLYCAGGFNWAGLFFFEFGLMLFSVALGYFVALVMYRTRLRGKLVILVIAAVLLGVLTLVGFFTELWSVLGRGVLAMLGFTSQNPFIGMASLIGLSALLLLGGFLIVRRADIRG